jgi:hypothetical protein
MTADDAIVLDGFLEEETVPGDLHGHTARFRLTVCPTDEGADERVDEMVLPCRITDPVMAAAVLRDLVPGDHLRVTGHLRLPRTPEAAMHLVVTALTVLQTALLLAGPAAVATAGVDRYGPYLCWLDADTSDVEVFTENGAWVGVADTPAEFEGLLEAFEQRHRADDEQP